MGWYGMFVACGIWCLADVSSVSPSSEQTDIKKFSQLISLPAPPSPPQHFVLSLESLLTGYKMFCSMRGERWFEPDMLLKFSNPLSHFFLISQLNKYVIQVKEGH